MDSHRNTQTAENQRVIWRNILLASIMLAGFAPGTAGAQTTTEKKGTTPYVTHFIFRPVQSFYVPGLGTATLLEALGTTQNMKGEKMLDKMSARCTALSVDLAPRNTSMEPASWQMPTVTRFFRPSIPATSTSRSQL